MSLPEGTKLGIYEILSPLGAGGMGEVYRARDTRLEREVAVKVLPESFAKNPERIARFEREAKYLAALNHPNIAAIYGLEESGGVRFLAMELVPGRSIDEMLMQGPLSVRESLDIAEQIARALEAAHEQAIIHRDLKPSNVLVTPQGLVKVLDFGLAKAYREGKTGTGASQEPTLPPYGETAQGMVMGTAAYMSPEQARGKAVDKRTDIWAFGCVLFEMLSGRQAFGGETVTDSLAATLVKEPEWTELPANTPARIGELIQRCLEKDPQQRLRDIGDARIAVHEALDNVKTRATVRSFVLPGRRRRPLRVAAWAALGAAAIGIAAWLATRAVPGPGPGAGVPERKYVAVLPFRDIGGSAEGQLLGEGMVETVSARLGGRESVQVLSPTATVAAAGKDQDPFRVAAGLGANIVLRGSIQRAGDRVRIAFSVWNVKSRAEIGGGTLDGSASDLFDLQDALVNRLSQSLHLAEPSHPRRASPALQTASQQERYLRAIGNLQHYNTESSVDAAISLLEPLAVEVPESAAVQAALGRGYLEKFSSTHDPGLVEKASAACTRARQINPVYPDAEITLGRLQTLTGKPREAIAEFKSALSAEPDNFEALLGLAAAENAAGNFTDAEKTFRQAIDLQPSYWGGYSKLAGFYFRRGDYKSAAEMFRKAAELSPANAVAWSNVGAAYVLMGDYDGALEAFRKSLAIEPTGFAYSNVGTTEFYLAHYEKSAEAFEHAVKLMPDLYRCWANLGDDYRWMPALRARAEPTYEKAIALCRRELSLNPSDALVRAILASSLAKVGKVREAEAEIKVATQSGAEDPEIPYHAAVVATIAHKNAEAIEWIRHAIGAGYSAKLVQRDPEFRVLRGDRAFQDFLEANSGQDSHSTS